MASLYNGNVMKSIVTISSACALAFAGMASAQDAPAPAPAAETPAAENLKAAIAGETHEFESMYPEFIAVAEEEGQKAAVRSFTWATEAEKEHADFYSVALKALESGDTSSLPRQYWICLVCGDTFKSLEGVDACPLCGTKAEKFLVIG